MKKFLTCVFAATILMNVQPAQADLLNTARNALTLYRALLIMDANSFMQELTAEEKAFVTEMKFLDSLLEDKEFKGQVGDEVLKKLKTLSAKVMNAYNAKQAETIRSLMASYNKEEVDAEVQRSIAELKKIVAELEGQLNGKTSAFMDLGGFWNQLFGIKTAFAGTNSVDELTELQKKEIELRMKLMCRDRGLEYVASSNDCCEASKINYDNRIAYCGCPPNSYESSTEPGACCDYNHRRLHKSTFLGDSDKTDSFWAYNNGKACGCSDGGVLDELFKTDCCKDGKIQNSKTGQYEEEDPICPCSSSKRRVESFGYDPDKGHTCFKKECCPFDKFVYSCPEKKCCEAIAEENNMCCPQERLGKKNDKYLCCPVDYHWIPWIGDIWMQ